MPNLLPPPRNSLILELQGQIMELLQEHGQSARHLRPDEGLIAVELVITNLFTNAMESAPSEDLREAERKRHMNAIVRLSSRIAAWPAKSHERM